MEAAQREFVALLHEELNTLVHDQAELRAIWSEPAERAKLLGRLLDRGFGATQMSAMRELLGATDGDLFDVLGNVAWATPLRTRQERAAAARKELAAGHRYGAAQRAFLDFVLDHYVAEGEGELAPEKLIPLLRLRYGEISDALAALGPAEEIRKAFFEFQSALYQK